MPFSTERYSLREWGDVLYCTIDRLNLTAMGRKGRQIQKIERIFKKMEPKFFTPHPAALLVLGRCPVEIKYSSELSFNLC